MNPKITSLIVACFAFSSSMAAVSESVKANKLKVAVPTHGGEEKLASGFDLGFLTTSGNSSSTFLSADLLVAKEIAQDIYFANLNYSYGENDGVTSAQELFFNASWKHLVSDRAYYGVRFDGRHDELADIDYRISLTGLVGYYWLKSETTTLSTEAGLGYTTESVYNLDDSYMNYYLGQNFEHWFTAQTRVYQSAAAFIPADATDNYKINLELGLETFVSSSISLKAYFQNKYDNAATAGREKNDSRFITGISYKF